MNEDFRATACENDVISTGPIEGARQWDPQKLLPA
jgi:hypothetical protein